MSPLQSLSLAILSGLTGCVLNLDKDDLTCDGPQALVDRTGAPNGYVRCADESLNRSEAVAVAEGLEGPSCALTDEASERSCRADADCARDNDRCQQYNEPSSGDAYCTCVPTCATDADCNSDEVCLNDLDLGEDSISGSSCVPASCRSGDDCAGTGECGVLYLWGDWELACRTTEDTCRTTADCEDDPNVQCVIREGAWRCESVGVPGRPLTGADRAPRTAPAIARRDWAAAAAPVLPADPALRARLGQIWADTARAEHASVASFARFSMELMALGAPPTLLAAAQQAAADEVRHAQRFFGLASAALGRPVGPGRLALGGLQHNNSAADILEALIREACVNETLAVAEAAAARQRCQDRVVGAVLDEVVADETQHAALAWRALRWLLETHPSLRPQAAPAFAAALRAPQHGSGSDAGLDAWGVLGHGAQAATREAAVEAVIRPAMAALLG